MRPPNIHPPAKHRHVRQVPGGVFLLTTYKNIDITLDTGVKYKCMKTMYNYVGDKVVISICNAIDFLTVVISLLAGQPSEAGREIFKEEKFQ